MPGDPMRWLSTDVEDLDARVLVLEYQLGPDSDECRELLGSATGNWNTARHTVTELLEMVTKLLARTR